jgi:hypothetical protein
MFWALYDKRKTMIADRVDRRARLDTRGPDMPIRHRPMAYTNGALKSVQISRHTFKFSSESD